MITLYTDGACLGNPGAGGYAAVWFEGDKEVVVSGATLETTNNRMELLAIIEGLQAVKQSSRQVIVKSDSKYVLDQVTGGHLYKWQKNGWRNSQGKPVVNQDLWLRLLACFPEFDMLRWEWVKGHSGIPGNERCDQIATAKACEIKHAIPRPVQKPKQYIVRKK